MKLTLLPVWATLALAGGLLAAPPAQANPTSAPFGASTLPAVPTRLTATGRVQPIGSQIQLSWVPVPRINNYKVYRDGQFLALSSRAFWTDYSVAAGETHTYTVTSFGAGGESHSSSSATATVPAGGGQVIYADTLENAWQPWGWANLDFGNTTLAHTENAIRVIAGPWQAMYLHHAPFSTSRYAAVTFRIHGGSQGGQRLMLKALRSGVPQPGVAIGPLTAGQWQSVSISLHDLGVANVSDMDGLWVQNASGAALPAFFLDEIALTAASSVAPPAAPVGLTATPQWTALCPKCGMAMAHIVLGWHPVSGATSYTVYRSGSKVKDSLTIPAWTDMSVVSGKAYTYTVAATGPGGQGSASAPASATAPQPPADEAGMTAPVNLTVTGLWQAAPTDVLNWTAVPGAVSYNLYQYDTQIATGLTGTTYTLPPLTFLWGLTYTVTAVGADGTETLPSAVATAQGAYDPTATSSSVPNLPVPTQLVATPEWNAGVPRIHLKWYGWDTLDTYSVYRDGQRVASGLWGLNYYDTAVSPGETHSYTVTGVNDLTSTPVEGAHSVAVSATALTSAPSAGSVPVQITGVQPDDDSVVVSFAAVPGAVDYRVYSLANPNSVKYSGGGLSIEMNGLDPINGADLVVEAVDKLGPFQKMDGMAGPGAMAMDGMHQAINGQGDPSDVPNVLAASASFHVTCKPFVLTGSQVFADTFRNEQPLTLQPQPDTSANPDGNGDAYGQYQNYSEVANDKWRIRNYVGDQINTKSFFMGNHFMDTLYDGGTARVNGPLHNNDASLVMMPRQTVDISGGGVLHVTFEVDAHFNERRWCDVIVAPATATLLNPGAKIGSQRLLSTAGNAFRWRIQGQSHIPEVVSMDSQTHLVENPLVPENNVEFIAAPGTARFNRYASGEPFDSDASYGTDATHLLASANGSIRDLDKRHRFDLYLTRDRFQIYEKGILAWDGTIPANLAMPVGPYQVYFVHQLYHTGNDRPEQVDYAPQDAYLYNYRPWADERHWDNMGQEVLSQFPSLTPVP